MASRPSTRRQRIAGRGAARHEPARHGRLDGRGHDEGRPENCRHSDHRADRPRDVRRSRKGDRGGMRRLSSEAGRFFAAADADRRAAGSDGLRLRRIVGLLNLFAGESRVIRPRRRSNGYRHLDEMRGSVAARRGSATPIDGFGRASSACASSYCMPGCKTAIRPCAPDDQRGDAVDRAARGIGAVARIVSTRGEAALRRRRPRPIFALVGRRRRR